MAIDMGAVWGRYGGAVPNPQHTTPVTNLAPHVDGGQGPAGASGSAGNAAASGDELRVRNVAVAIVLAALALLWLMGAFAFRGIRL